MAHTKSALKRARQSAKNRTANVAAAKAMKVARKALIDAVAKKDVEASKKAYAAYCSVLDKTSKRGIIARNQAVRKKARAAAHVRALTAAK